MALLWTDGFEGYGDTASERVEDIIGRRYEYAGFIEVKDDGRFGGWSIQPEYLNCWFRTPALTTNNTLIVCFALKWAYDFIYNGAFCSMYSDVDRGAGLGSQSDGTIILFLDAVEIARSVPGVLNYKKWHWIEFKVVCDNTAGSYEVKVDGKTVLSASGVDTQVGALAYHDKMLFRGLSRSAVKVPRYDDLLIMDGTGVDYNDFIGQRRIVAIVPNGDTATVNWTVSGGANHWELVDDLDPDDDTNYVEDTVNTNQDRWTYEALADLDSIDSLCLITDIRVTDANTYDLITIVKSGGVAYPANAGTISVNTYAMYDRLMLVDPDTLVAWTQGGVNDVEMGVEVG